MCANEFEEERRRAEVFDALSHPTRILILKALNESPAGFADLKKQLGIDSSGHLQHHISKLNSLVKTDENGKYALSDEGKDALNSVETVEKVTESGAKHKPKTVTTKTSNILKLASLALVVLLVASCSVAVYQHNIVSVLQNELGEQDGVISGLNSQVDVLNATIGQQNEKMLQLTDALNLAKSVFQIESPEDSCYLTTGEQAESNMTKIFLESSKVWLNYHSGISPFPLISVAGSGFPRNTENVSVSITFYTFFDDYAYMVHSGDKQILMIGATIRSDYTLEDAENIAYKNVPINNSTDMFDSLSFIKLTPKLYTRDGTVIDAKDALLDGYFPPIDSQEFPLKIGETKQVVFYLEPSSWNIDHYEIFVDYVAANPQSTQ